MINNDLRQLKLTQSERDKLLSGINNLRQLSSHRLTESMEKFIIDNFKELVCFFPNIGISVTFGDCFERLVINKDVVGDNKNRRLVDYTQIKYPPKSIEKFLGYNRASMKGQSVFYGGYGQLATALETRPKIGDVITTSKWMQKQHMPLKYFPVFYKQEVAMASEFKNDWVEYIDFIESLDPNLSKVLLELLAFITEVFIKPVNKDNKVEYLFSALFSHYYLTNKNSNIQCLYYPSVPIGFASSNIACLPETLDSYFECVEVVEDIIIVDHNESRGWLSIRTAEALNVNPNATGKILWSDKKSESEMEELKKMYNISD